MVVVANSARVQGIVLAGVHAWGESLLEEICCRPLLPVLGRPLVWYVLNWLGRNGISRASICANSDTGIFRQCLGTGRMADVSLSYYADLMPRGPAGCMRDAAAGSCADTYVVVDGTIATRVDLGNVLTAHHASGAAVTMVVAQGTESAAAEPTGIYVVSRAALEHVPVRGYQDIKEMLIPRLYDAGERVVPYMVKQGETLRVTSAASYLSVLGWAMQDPGKLPGQYNRIGEALVHVTSYIARSARLLGPVVVAPACAIEDGATVVGPTSVGPHSTIGRRAVISRTAMWSRTCVKSGAFIDHSVLMSGARVEEQVTVRDTVCMPQGSGAGLSPDRLYWGIPPLPTPAADVQDLESRADLKTLLPMAGPIPAPTDAGIA